MSMNREWFIENFKKCIYVYKKVCSEIESAQFIEVYNNSLIRLEEILSDFEAEKNNEEKTISLIEEWYQMTHTEIDKVSLSADSIVENGVETMHDKFLLYKAVSDVTKNISQQYEMKIMEEELRESAFQEIRKLFEKKYGDKADNAFENYKKRLKDMYGMPE